MFNDSPPATSGHPRGCLISLRGANKHAAWCSNYEFEDVIRSVDDVELFSLTPGTGYATRLWLSRRLVWRKGLRQLVPHLNPGVQPITLTRDYDLFVYICMNPADLLYLSSVSGWKDRCKTKICFMAEFYSGWLEEYEFHLSLLRDFDHVVLPFEGSVPSVADAVGRPCHHVPLGADVLRFSPYPDPPPRCIDVYSMGRRSEPVHRVFLDMASRKQIFYVYDTIPGVYVLPRDHREHRDLVANCARRSRFFVTYPAKIDATEETRGQSEVGARFFEGAAAGAVMVGKAPDSRSFARDFDWPDAVVELGPDGDTLAASLRQFLTDSDRTAALSRKNAVEAMRRFDWGYRWQEILRIAGLPPSPALISRQEQLNELAFEVQSQPVHT